MNDDDTMAFPSAAVGTSPGMSLRDYFAAQALPVCIVQAGDGVKDWDLNALFGKTAVSIPREQIVAALAYRYADYMLARRKLPRG